MLKPSVDDMLKGKKSRYSLVIAVAKRAREINNELSQKGTITTDKCVNLAINDFKAHKYDILEPEVDD